MSTQPNDPVIEITRSILTEAAQRPWLAALLMRRKPDWLTRLAHLAQRVRDLPRHTRRALRRKLASGLAAAALLLALAGTPTVYAAGIAVDGTNCTLTEAINSANNDNALGNGCANGSGADIITLSVDVGLTAALPNISTAITIQGNNHTISRASGALRILFVTAAGNLTLNQATISGGTATGSSGGGIRNLGTLTVNNSTLSGNSATNGGGIYNSKYANLTVTNSTLSGNSATSSGGGIYNYSTATIVNSTISGNSATNGGGIRNYSHGTNIGTVTVRNSIVAQQTSGVDCFNEGGGSFTSQGYNIESATTCNFTQGTDQRSVTSGSLNMQALANNGSNPHPFTHALGAGSVAIDKIPIGTNGCASTNTDERGAKRAGGGTQGGSACDIGAYEVSDQTPTAVTLRDLTAATQAAPGIIGAALASFAALGAVWIGRRRLKVR